MCYFWFENLSSLCKLIVYGSQTLRSTQQTQRFPKHPNPVFTVENSADDNQIHTTHSKSVHTTCSTSSREEFLDGMLSQIPLDNYPKVYVAPSSIPSTFECSFEWFFDFAYMC